MNFSDISFTGAIGFLLVSSTVTMAVPFSIGKVLDIIYSTSDNSDDAKSQLNQLCGVLICVFGVGAVCNFARVYLMSLSGMPSSEIVPLH